MPPHPEKQPPTKESEKEAPIAHFSAGTQTDPPRVQVFFGHKNPLSNFYPSPITQVVDGKEVQFRSVEEALTFMLAHKFGHEDVAKRVWNSRHAGEAKKILSDLSDKLFENRELSVEARELHEKFETTKKTLVNDLVKSKADSCRAFRNALRQSGSKILVHSTYPRHAGKRQSVFESGLHHSDPKNYSFDPLQYPTRNLLGQFMMTLRANLKDESDYGPDTVVVARSQPPPAEAPSSAAGCQGGIGDVSVPRKPESIFCINGACFFCGLQGHNFEQCKKLRPVTCYCCSRRGHVQRVCPRRGTRPKNFSHGSGNYFAARNDGTDFPPLPRVFHRSRNARTPLISP